MRNEREGSAFWHAVWTRLQKDPAAASAVAYFWVIAVGFAHLFGSGMAFNLNVIDLASPSDFLVAGVRQAWIVRQQRAKPVGSIAADCVMDPGAIDQEVDAAALSKVAGPANRRAVVHLVADGRIGPAVAQEADRRLDLRAGETPVRGGNAMQDGCLHV